MYTSNGTHPAGSMWARGPIPTCAGANGGYVWRHGSAIDCEPYPWRPENLRQVRAPHLPELWCRSCGFSREISPLSLLSCPCPSVSYVCAVGARRNFRHRCLVCTAWAPTTSQVRTTTGRFSSSIGCRSLWAYRVAITCFRGDGTVSRVPKCGRPVVRPSRASDCSWLAAAAFSPL